LLNICGVELRDTKEVILGSKVLGSGTSVRCSACRGVCV
jgi:hypothetical protein